MTLMSYSGLLNRYLLQASVSKTASYGSFSTNSGSIMGCGFGQILIIQVVLDISNSSGYIECSIVVEQNI